MASSDRTTRLANIRDQLEKELAEMGPCDPAVDGADGSLANVEAASELPLRDYALAVENEAGVVISQFGLPVPSTAKS